MTRPQPDPQVQAALEDLKAYVAQSSDRFLPRLIDRLEDALAAAPREGGYVGGDSIQTGDITDATGLVIGRGQVIMTLSIIQQPVHQAAAEKLDALPAQKPAVSPELVEDAKAEVRTIDPALEAPAPEQKKWLEQRFRNIARMGPDILDVVTATFLNRTFGVALAVRKIAEKAREEAGLEPVS